MAFLIFFSKHSEFYLFTYIIVLVKGIIELKMLGCYNKRMVSPLFSAKGLNVGFNDITFE